MLLLKLKTKGTISLVQFLWSQISLLIIVVFISAYSAVHFNLPILKFQLPVRTSSQLQVSAWRAPLGPSSPQTLLTHSKPKDESLRLPAPASFLTDPEIIPGAQSPLHPYTIPILLELWFSTLSLSTHPVCICSHIPSTWAATDFFPFVLCGINKTVLRRSSIPSCL